MINEIRSSAKPIELRWRSLRAGDAHQHRPGPGAQHSHSQAEEQVNKQRPTCVYFHSEMLLFTAADRCRVLTRGLEHELLWL
jgi:hypothetical protein